MDRKHKYATQKREKSVDKHQLILIQLLDFQTH